MTLTSNYSWIHLSGQTFWETFLSQLLYAAIMSDYLVKTSCSNRPSRYSRSPLLLKYLFCSTPSNFLVNEPNIFSFLRENLTSIVIFPTVLITLLSILQWQVRSLEVRLYECRKQWVRKTFAWIANVWGAISLIFVDNSRTAMRGWISILCFL